MEFMNELVAGYDPQQPIHVIVDNLSTHKPKHDRWQARHSNVHFHFTPTRASWLNQIECWFSILGRQALQGASFRSARELRQAVDRFIESYNLRAVPFEWKKEKVHSVHPKRYYAYLSHRVLAIHQIGHLGWGWRWRVISPGAVCKFRIVDKAREYFSGSKGTGLQPRSLVVMDDLGIIEQVLSNGRFHILCSPKLIPTEK